MQCNVKRIKKTKYCISDLDKKINICKRVKNKFTTQASGLEYTLEVVKSVWAGVSTTSGTIWIDGVATNDGASHIFVIRYRTDLTNEMYIQLKNDNYKILDMTIPEENNSWLVLRCKKLAKKDLKGFK